jgi:hypothetical protein
MPRNGHRHRLILYTYMLNRWWKLSLGIGAIVVAMAIGLRILPGQLPQYHFLMVSDFTLWAVAGAGGYAVLLSFFLIAIAKSAYVQPCATHLRLITPFLRMNISYRRIRKASSVDMKHLFAVSSYKGWRFRLARPLAAKTAIVLEMQGWPLPHWVLNLFLSSFFFPDKTSRLALLVPKWMDFSMEMESFRSNFLDSQHETGNDPQSALLASFSNSKK